jgi:hypothetical protein
MNEGPLRFAEAVARIDGVVLRLGSLIVVDYPSALRGAAT